MSFTQDVKLETSLLKAEGDEARAELSALIQLTSSLSITHEGMTLLVQTEICTRILSIFSGSTGR